MTRLLIAATLIALAAGSARAGSPEVGDPAPELDGVEWVANAPEVASLAALRGEVVLVAKLGPGGEALLGRLQRLEDDHGERGLRVIALLAEAPQAAEVRAAVRGRTYPIAAGVAKYDAGGALPRGWLIGLGGRVIWAGDPRDEALAEALEPELRKVRYPGLGRSELHEALHGALRRYLKGDLAGARREARALAAAGTAVADATYLAERITRIAARRLARAKGLAQERRYARAVALYTTLAKTFGEEAEGRQAAARLRELRRDEAVIRELKAASSLRKLEASLASASPEEREAALARWAQGNGVAGTKVAEDALREARSRDQK